MKMLDLFRKAKGIILVMLAVYLVSFGAGYAAGKLKLTNINAVRESVLFELNRSLENKVPGYGPLLQKYKDWERRKLMTSIFRGKAVSAMFIIFLNNWIAADLTMVVRAVFLLPMILYPFGRFAQGLSLAQNASGYRVWMVWITEFGGYFLTLCGALAAVLWTFFFRRFHFDSRKAALLGGLKVFGVLYVGSAVFFFIGAYAEMMLILGMSIR
jgi:hypothetical protein